VISEAKFFAIHFQGNSRAAFCSIEQAGVIQFARQRCRVWLARAQHCRCNKLRQ